MTEMARLVPPAFVSPFFCVERPIVHPPGLLLATTGSDGHANQLLHKNAARHRRLEELRRTLEDDEIDAPRLEKEYAGLIRLGDPYDPHLFSAEHAHFKTSHNQAFASLSQNLCNDEDDKDDDGCNVFYLDGPDGGTTTHLLGNGFARDNLYVANEWEDSIAALQSEPLNLSAENCICGRAQTVLRSNFDHVEFAAYYLDGCGGQTEPLMEMINAIFSRSVLPNQFGVGFTLTQAEPGGRELLDRVQDVTRHVFAKARSSGYDMRHVGDDPERYGVDINLSRKHDYTCTSWVVCSRIV